MLSLSARRPGGLDDRDRPAHHRLDGEIGGVEDVGIRRRHEGRDRTAGVPLVAPADVGEDRRLVGGLAWLRISSIRRCARTSGVAVT